VTSAKPVSDGLRAKLLIAEQELIRYRLLFQQARDIILFVRQSDARILEANQAASDAYGYSAEELTQLTDYELRTPDQFENLTKYLAHTSEGQNIAFETTHRRKDGSSFPVEIAARSAVINEELVVLKVIRDVSERHQAEAVVSAALRQAIDASRQKSEFVATMSHEIRTPMNGVIGMTELLLRTDLDEQQRGYALTVRESGEALLGVINDILDFSKIEAGKMELEVSEFDLTQVVEGIAAVLTPHAHQKRLSLMSFVDPKIPARVIGDPGRLRQVLLNLASNAIKFTETGDVVISAVLRQTASRDLRLEFSVKDNGMGMTADAKAKLFQPFRQGDGSASRRYGGTGLGLSISQRLVNLMGGSITADSAVGKGSTFSFQLPLTSANDGPHSPAHAPVTARVLIVSDDRAWRDIAGIYLRSWSMSYEIVADPRDAVACLDAGLRAERFDVVLIDLAMPFMDGFGLADTIRREARFEGLRLLLISPFDDAGKVARAAQTGFSAYLVQPIRQSQLFDAIVNTLPAKRELLQSAKMSADCTEAIMRILVAEDNATNRHLALEQLHLLGFSAEAVTNGGEAVAAVSSGEYDLIFMDCQMPEMDGFAATRAIRTIEGRSGRHTRIVAMTANALSSDHAACIEAGMDAYLSKPVSLERLRECLDDAFAQPAQTTAVTARPPVVVDTARLSDLFNSDKAAIGAFLESALPDLERLVNELAVTDSRDERIRLAHELKGVSANLGAQKLSSAAAALERDLHTMGEGLVSLEPVRDAASVLAAVVASYNLATT
jgi:two-component system sensor histidine kinase/response regulator